MKHRLPGTVVCLVYRSSTKPPSGVPMRLVTATIPPKINDAEVSSEKSPNPMNTSGPKALNTPNVNVYAP
ncbi:unnamed protein product [Phytophthora lilii]|uniref:Unnamed protein product n=1 Tax=Phytophthora lilii TaxID=2077276 RepID=A0A9W7D783_9STRA|nr:unnamed protein product [Phytophthora lilii]